MSRQERLFIFILSTTLTLIQAALAIVFGIALLNVTGSAEKDLALKGFVVCAGSLLMLVPLTRRIWQLRRIDWKASKEAGQPERPSSRTGSQP